MQKKLYCLLFTLFTFVFLTFISCQTNTSNQDYETFDSDAAYASLYAMLGSYITGGGTAYATYFFMKNSKDDTLIPSAAVLTLPLIVGAFTYYQLYNYFYQRALEKKYLMIKKAVKNIEKDSWLSKDLKLLDTSIDQLTNNKEIEKHLKDLAYTIKSTQSLIQTSLQKAGKLSLNYTTFEAQYKQLQEETNALQSKLNYLKNLVEYLTLKEVVEKVETNTKELEAASDFINYLSIKFGTKWPLVVAKNYIISIFSLLIQIQQKINTFSKNETNLSEKIAHLNEKIKPILTTLEQKMSIITKDSNYALQVHHYDNYMVEKAKSTITKKGTTLNLAQ